MRPFFLFLLICILTSASNAQNPVNVSQPQTELKILDARWLASGGDSVYVGDNWGSGSAVTTVAGAISMGVSPLNATGNGMVFYRANTGWNSGRNSKKRTPINCSATVVLQNASAKMVKAFSLDYVFMDPQTRGEFLRYEFHAKKRMSPGKSSKITQDIFQKVGKYRKFYTPIKPQSEILLRTKEALTKVVIKRIEYSDGSVWQRP
jgi:hypothetical protein